MNRETPTNNPPNAPVKEASVIL